MNKCFLVIYCFLCAGMTIHAQQITQSDSGLPAVGILGSLGISATLVTAIMMSSVEKLRTDLKVCQKLLEVKMAEVEMAEDEECIEDDGQCDADLDECNTVLLYLQDVAARDEDIDLIDGICSIRQDLCSCLTIDDENECIDEGCQYNSNRGLCVPS